MGACGSKTQPGAPGNMDDAPASGAPTLLQDDVPAEKPKAPMATLPPTAPQHAADQAIDATISTTAGSPVEDRSIAAGSPLTIDDSAGHGLAAVALAPAPLVALDPKAEFDAAVSWMQELPKDGAVRPSNEFKLTAYGLYKQVTKGDNTTPKPGVLAGFEVRYKWDAWHAHKGKDVDTARREYVQHIESLKPKSTPQARAADVAAPAEKSPSNTGEPTGAASPVSADGAAAPPSVRSAAAMPLPPEGTLEHMAEDMSSRASPMSSRASPRATAIEFPAELALRYAKPSGPPKDPVEEAAEEAEETTGEAEAQPAAQLQEASARRSKENECC